MSDDKLMRRTGPDGSFVAGVAQADSESCLRFVGELTQIRDDVVRMGQEVDKATESMAALIRYYKLMVRLDGVISPEKKAGKGHFAQSLLINDSLSELVSTLFEQLQSSEDLTYIPVEELLSPERLEELRFNINIRAIAHEGNPDRNPGLEQLNDRIGTVVRNSRSDLRSLPHEMNEHNYLAGMIIDALGSDRTLNERVNTVNALVGAAEALSKPEQHLVELNRIRKEYAASGNFFVSNQGLNELHELQNALEDYASEFNKLREENIEARLKIEKLVGLKAGLGAGAERFKETAAANGWIENPPKGLEKAIRFADEILKVVGQDPATMPAFALQIEMRQEAPDLPGAEFEVLDYRRYVQEEAAVTNNMMHYLQQKFHIDDNDLKLLLGKGAEEKDLAAQTEKVIVDIIDRNMIPDDVIYESDVKSLCEGAVKEVRRQVADRSYEAGRHTLARALMDVFPTDDFDPARNYETRPFVNPEKSGIRAKSTLFNYFVFLKRDEYNPDAWYKSGTLSDLVNKWAEGGAADRQTALAEMLNKKWRFGKELSGILAERMDQKFESIRGEKGLAAGNNLKAEMYAAVRERFPSSLDLLKDLTRSLPEERLAAFDIRLPSDIHDKYLSGMNSYTIKTEYRPAAGEERLAKLSAALNDNAAVRENLEKCAHLLKDTNEFDMLCRMFDTKKRYRLFNGSSAEYTRCQTALSDLRAKRNDILRFLDGLKDDSQNGERLALTAEDITVMEPMLRDLASLQTACAERMTDYNNKVFVENMADKAQSAGMARFAGVQGLAEIIRTADGRPLIEQAEFRKNDQTAVQARGFKELYEEEYNKRIVGGKKDIHRNAAAAAKDRQAKQQLNGPQARG